MLDQPHIKAYLLLAVACVVALATAIWYFAANAPRDARADEANLRDVDAAADPRASQPVKHPLPLASIPWKRDTDTFATVLVGTSHLPWLRDLDSDVSLEQPFRGLGNHSAVVQCAALPWDEERAATCPPVFLQVARLPWRQ